MESKIVLEKLGSTNYASWSQRFRSFLVSRRLAIWLALEPDVERLSPDELEQADIALAYIRMYVDDRWLRVLSACTSARQAWESLRTANISALQPLSGTLQSRMFALRMKAGESVDDFFNRVEEVQADLDRIGMALPECTVVGVILRGLSTTFASSASSLAINASTFTLITLRAALIAIESLQDISKPKVFRVDGGRSYKNKPSDQVCHHCGQKGHIRPFCKLWHTSEGKGLVESTYAEGYPQARPSARVATTVPGVPTCLTASSSPLCTIPGPWLVDSGATDGSCHMII